MTGLLTLIGAIALFVLLIVWAVKYTKKINARKKAMYEQLAQRLGLVHTETKYLMAKLNNLAGEYRGMKVAIWEKMEGSGKNRTVVTRILITAPGFDFDFKIGKEHFFTKIGKALGMKDIEFGDPEFDKKFLLKSDNEEKFRRLITPNIQHEIRNLGSDIRSSIRMQKGEFSYMNYGPLANEKQFKSFEKILDFMLMLAEKSPR